MGVSIIRGAIGSGKSGMCFDGIEKIHNENPSAHCVMIVPDHYSYETEKRAVERFGGTGLNNIEVLTLRRMAINALSMAELNHLTDAGRQMLIYKAVTKACEELRDVPDMDIKLISSMKRQGFLDVAASLISEMKRYLVSPQMLAEKAEAVRDNRTLRNKLTALANVYGKYIEYTENSGCTDSEDDLGRLAERIERGCGYDSNTYVWVDRFDKFMPQQLRVLEALLKKGVHMTVSVCNPESEDESERELYIQTERTLDTVRQLAQIYGYEGMENAGRGLAHLKAKPDLYTLLRSWTEDFEYPEVPRNMAMFQSRDTYSEIERIACKITDLTRGGECRFRDIALMCGREQEYIHLIEAVFGEYEIPYFADRKIILSDHPIAMQILSLFQILEEDWSYESVFRYLRSGFIYRRKNNFAAPISQDEIDELDNFVLRCGIRGRKRWLSEEAWISEDSFLDAAFGDEKSAEAGSFIDGLRREVAAPVEKFTSKIKGRKSAEEIASALFEYLEDINLYAGLKREISRLRDEGRPSEAEQFTQIWNLILDVLNQTITALGNEKLKAPEFAEYMSVGLSKCEIRIIPSGIDQVYVGSAERISRTSVKVMFVVGAKNGTFPEGIKTEGFLSNNDRNTLKNDLGIAIAPDTKRKTDEQYFKVYRAMCAVQDKLYFSYSIQDEEGGTQTASHMLTEIYRKFPKIRVSNNLTANPEGDIVYISSPKATLHRLIINLSKRNSNKRNPMWDIVYDWYAGKEEWRGALSLMDRADYYDRRGVVLKGDIANLLYEGQVSYSQSRINTFASCPFSYFMKYGLKVYKRDEWEISYADMGTYAHRVIKEFCETVENGADTNAEKISAWNGLTDARRDEILNGIIEKTRGNMLSSDTRDKERTASILSRMGKTIGDAARLVQKSLSAGEYAEHGMEYDFRAELSPDAVLEGTIDRIDTCESSSKPYMRIIDYKTGATEFDIVNIANGFDMQMVLYALGAQQFMRETENIDAEVTGIYYTGVRSKYRELTPTVTEQNIRDKNEHDLCLDGVTFAEEDEQTRKKMVYLMDNGFFANGESVYTKVKLNKDEVIQNVSSLDEINGLMEHVREKVLDIDARARNGEISLNPYKRRDNIACDRCDYASVCKFDEAYKTTREARGKSDEIWEAMKTKGAALRGGERSGGLDE